MGTPSFPIGIVDDRAKRHRRAAIGQASLERHLDRDEALIEIVEREAGEKRVGREAIRMGHAPRRVAEMAVHRREDGANFRFGLGRHLVGVVRFPHVGMRGIGDDAAMRRCDDLVTKPSLPPIGLGQEAAPGRLPSNRNPSASPAQC